MAGANQIEEVHGAVGIRIRIVREAIGLSQEELARRVKLTRTSMTNIECGRQRLLLHSVEKFAQALGTSPKNLMKGIWW
jgi:transcriptional regulator with XRE-family HTH domain